jgi:hypothetical protein
MLANARTDQAWYKSLELFIQESAATLKELLEKYTDNMTLVFHIARGSSYLHFIY